MSNNSSGIIRVFNTEANALANVNSSGASVVDGSEQGRLNAVTVSGAETIANVAGEVTDYHIYNKYYYRIEANEPVSEFHIDWDEGEDNSPEKASIEIIKLETPSFSVVTDHIYTEHKHFFPLIRVKSSDGFLSKWYTNDASTSLTELESREAYTSIPAGQNEFSIVSKEKAGKDRIASFYPSNLPPIGVLKVDTKRIYANIDNTKINGTYPLLYTFSTSTATTKPNIKFTVQDSEGAVREHTLDNSTNRILSTTSGLTPNGSGGYMSVSCIPTGNFSSANVQAVERVEINAYVSGVGGGGAPNWNIIWSSTNDAYVDIHYETATADTNGNYHTRIFFHTGSSDSEGGPSGSSTPDNYSALKVGVGSGTLSSNSVANELHTAITANIDGQGINLPLTISSVGANGGDAYIDMTVSGLGGVTAFGESTAANEEIDCSTITAGGGTITKTTSIKRLMRVELLNAKNLADTDRVFVMTFDAGTNLGTDASTTLDKTVAVLSNGSPIVELEEPFTQVTLDGTESRTRASNVDIANYYIDTDKLNKSGAVQQTNSTQQSDSLITSSTLINGTDTISYASDLKDHILDSDSRIVQTSRLCRLQVTDDSGPATNTNHKDALDTSSIESFDSTNYTAANRYMPSSLEHKDLLLYGRYSLSHTGSNLNAYGRDTLCWRNRANSNNIDSEVIMGGDGVDQFPTTSCGAGKHPLNYLLIAKTEKFDRIHFRLDSTWQGVTTSNVEVTAYYTANDGTWKPLTILDDTQGLNTSGSIKFNMPSDWAQKSKATIDNGTWTGPVHVDNVGTNIVDSQAPEDLWTFNAYGIIIAFNVYGVSLKTRVMNVWPYNNSHSQEIKVVDPHHVSMNSIAIAQSISFGRTAKTISVEDKFGKADIRKIGASGGNVTFGGIDLGGSDDHRKTIVSYQKNGTPVFLDITHKSGEITRFFGMINKITEDHPAGAMIPKWAVTMQTSYILELTSDGTISTNKIPIGGAESDVRRSIST